MVANGDTESTARALRHNLLEFSELMLFLLVAMTYNKTLWKSASCLMPLRAWLVGQRF